MKSKDTRRKLSVHTDEWKIAIDRLKIAEQKKVIPEVKHTRPPTTFRLDPDALRSAPKIPEPIEKPVLTEKSKRRNSLVACLAVASAVVTISSVALTGSQSKEKTRFASKSVTKPSTGQASSNKKPESRKDNNKKPRITKPLREQSQPPKTESLLYSRPESRSLAVNPVPRPTTVEEKSRPEAPLNDRSKARKQQPQTRPERDSNNNTADNGGIQFSRTPLPKPTDAGGASEQTVSPQSQTNSGGASTARRYAPEPSATGGIQPAN